MSVQVRQCKSGMQGAEYTQQSYCQTANDFKQKWLQSHPEVNSALQLALQVICLNSAIRQTSVGYTSHSLILYCQPPGHLQEEAVSGNTRNAAAKVLEEQYW